MQSMFRRATKQLHGWRATKDNLLNRRVNSVWVLKDGQALVRLTEIGRTENGLLGSLKDKEGSYKWQFCDTV